MATITSGTQIADLVGRVNDAAFIQRAETAALAVDGFVLGYIGGSVTHQNVAAADIRVQAVALTVATRLAMNPAGYISESDEDRMVRALTPGEFTFSELCVLNRWRTRVGSV